MNIGQLSTNKLVRPSGREDLPEIVVAAGSRELAPPTEDREWSLSKPVFVALICLSYVSVALAFYFMFNEVHR